MTNSVSYKHSRLEYIKKQDTQIISILGFVLPNINELGGLLRKLELLAKRTKIKEIWIPMNLSQDIKLELENNGYKEVILGVHPTENKQLNGFKKILN